MNCDFGNNIITLANVVIEGVFWFVLNHYHYTRKLNVFKYRPSDAMLDYVTTKR